MDTIVNFLTYEFQNEIDLFNSFHWLGQTVYIFYAVAAILVIRPHIKQAMKYRHGEAGKGDFHHGAHYEAMFWRLAPLGYAIVINSKLLFLSVFIDLIGRFWTNYEAHKAEHRFQTPVLVKDLENENFTKHEPEKLVA